MYVLKRDKGKLDWLSLGEGASCLRTGFCIYPAAGPVYNHSGDYGRKVPPVPIPNTEVKLSYAESTCRDTGREDRASPLFIIKIRLFGDGQSKNCSLAQSVEHRTVNPSVVSSSLTGAAILGRQKRFFVVKPRCQRGFSLLKGLEIHVDFRRYKIGIFPYWCDSNSHTTKQPQNLYA